MQEFSVSVGLFCVRVSCFGIHLKGGGGGGVSQLSFWM
jgi:hypothetical protein